MLSILWYLVEPEFIQKKQLALEYLPNSPDSTDSLTSVQTTTSIKFIHSRRWISNISTNVFFFISVYASIQVLRVNSYFGTILQILEALGDKECNYFYTQLFTALLPLGFLCLPLIEYSFKSYGFLGSFHILNGLSIAYNVIVLIPILPLQVLTFILFIICRALLYSLIGTYIAHMFGPLNSGKMYGLLSWIGVGLNSLQYPLYIMATKFYPGYRGLEYLNIFYLFLCIPLIWLVISLLKKILLLYSDGDIKEQKIEVYEEVVDENDVEKSPVTSNINKIQSQEYRNGEVYNQLFNTSHDQLSLEIEEIEEVDEEDEEDEGKGKGNKDRNKFEYSY